MRMHTALFGFRLPRASALTNRMREPREDLRFSMRKAAVRESGSARLRYQRCWMVLHRENSPRKKWQPVGRFPEVLSYLGISAEVTAIVQACRINELPLLAWS